VRVALAASLIVDEPAISVRGLTRRFGDLLALDDVTFDVEAATVFGLLGPNGAGKTTAVRILATLLPQDAGQARVLGIDVAEHPGRVRRRIGLAGQNAAVDRNLTGRENLRLIGRLNQMHRSAFRARADELLERFDLTDAAGRPVREYSGGMRRRLDVAAALVAEPDVLFLDEPTTGLDLPSRNSLWEVIGGLVDAGTTVVLTTQYLEEADRVANRIAVIDHGRLIANDTPAALKSRTGATVVEIGFDGEVTAARAADVLDQLADVRVERRGEVVTVTSTDGARLLIDTIHVLDVGAISPQTVQVRAPTLDDAFLRLTGSAAAAEARS
jgi:daunorubicin resistance ABC transporter ATP-binding subunit